MRAVSLLTWATVTIFCLTGSVLGIQRHRCNKQKQELKVVENFSPTFEAELIPRFLEPPGSSNPLSCQWEIQFDAKDFSNRQLILTAHIDQSEIAISRKDQRNRTHLMFGWQQADSVVTKGMVHAYSLNSSKTLMVESFWNPAVQLSSHFKLRFLIPPAGQCHEATMLSFHGNCYTLSRAQQGAAAALQSIGGGAQLASFASKTEINNFVLYNADHLNLTQPVRLGLFYRRADQAVISVVRAGSGDCGLRASSARDPLIEPPSPGEPTDITCASLRVDFKSKRSVIEFNDCNKPMASLVSFKKVAEGQRDYSSCNTNLLTELARVPELKTTPRPIQLTYSGNSSSTEVSQIGLSRIIIISIICNQVLRRMIY